jgi:acetolactate synthase-1/2/3 large subunit
LQFNKTDRITVNQYITQTLATHGVTHIFGLTGARIVSFIQCIYENPSLKFVNMLHEQSVAYAACGYAQSGGRLGVAVSTSGPGATNLLTGIANAFCDSIPCLFITGQSPTNGLRGEAKIRNRSVQEVDIVGMAAPVTKYAVCLKNARQIKYELEKALFLAQHKRPGPVLIDLPEDVQFQWVDPDELKCYTAETETQELRFPDILPLITGRTRPILMLGNGAHGCAHEISQLVHSTNIPVVASMSAVDICDNSYTYYLGVEGNYGKRCANFALQNSDLIIAIGCGMTPRYTGADLRQFAPEAKVIRIDIDDAELVDRTLKSDEVKICCDANAFMRHYRTELSSVSPSAAWLVQIIAYKNKYYRESVTDTYGPYSVIDAINQLRVDHDIVTADDGQNQIWALQGLTFGPRQRFLSTSGLSTMGYSLPGAIGAYYANPSAQIVCLCGDGGLQMGIYELQTIVREQMPITVVVLNNRALGMVRMLQDTYYDSKHYATSIDYTVPNFCAVAEAYGISSKRVDSLEQLRQAFQYRRAEPLLIEVMLDTENDVHPRIVQRRPIFDAFPLLSDAEVEENMIVRYERKQI